MKTKLFFSLLILTLLLSACSNSEQKPNQPSQPTQEVKAEGSAAAADNPNVVKAEGSIAVMPQATEKPANATPANVAPVSADLASAPKIELSAKKVDFGNVAEDKTLVRDFVVKNTGKSTLNIEAVNPSCGCTTVDFPKTIQPGKSGKIKLKVETGKGEGQRTKTVTISSNDPQERSVVFEFSFTVKAAAAKAK